MLALLGHPDQLDALRSVVAGGDAPGLSRAVEELLRWDSPVQLDVRIALADTYVGGEKIAAGETVMTLLGAANRDPAHYEDPETLDLERDEGPPMSFGSGIHFCLGAALARMEGRSLRPVARALRLHRAVNRRRQLPRHHRTAGPR